MFHLSFVDITARLDYLEPGEFLNSFVRTLNGLTNGILDGNAQCAGEFDKLIDRIFHLERDGKSVFVVLGFDSQLDG